MTGDEVFSDNGTFIGFSVRDFWCFEFSNLWDMLGYVAEFLVAKALGRTEPDNCDGWTPYDIRHNGKSIEVKATSYYQPWKKNGRICMHRIFSIRKPQRNNNDIYVFCLLNGESRAEANPMLLENWEFYVVPTETINRECGESKTITLTKIRAITGLPHGVGYGNLGSTIEALCDKD